MSSSSRAKLGRPLRSCVTTSSVRIWTLAYSIRGHPRIDQDPHAVLLGEGHGQLDLRAVLLAAGSNPADRALLCGTAVSSSSDLQIALPAIGDAVNNHVLEYWGSRNKSPLSGGLVQCRLKRGQSGSRDDQSAARL